MNLESPQLKRIAEVAKVTPELVGPDVPNATQELMAELLAEYPGIRQFGDYLELIASTGGLHAHNDDFDLGLYGLIGQVVPSFDENYHVEDDHFFVFGELMYPRADDTEVFLALDTNLDHDTVFARTHEGEHERVAGSVAELLSGLAEGRYPLYPAASET
jgi:hypothetical protein